ncbi:MAG TPA: hypothetical protein VFC52_02050, partial [Solirubrobacterales bacterium]|nr:hypothetical protein [Solirubrobacterales bacterium]
MLSMVSLAEAAPTTIAEGGQGAGRVLNPQSVAVDQGSGDLYVADTNNFRVDKFSEEGGFLLAWGYGVRDGVSRELQTCGPEAVPPTLRCFKGEGANVSQGTGAIRPQSVAVDQSSGYVYVSDTGSRRRVSAFDSSGGFLRSFGAAVASGGAEATGNLTAGSKSVTGVVLAERNFVGGQTLLAPGVPPNTEITAVGNGTLTLAKAATETIAGAALSAAEDPGNVPTDEEQVITVSPGAIEGNFKLKFTPPMGSAETSANIRFNASAADVETALKDLPAIGAGNVEVTLDSGGNAGGGSEPGGPWTVEFKGARYSDTNVAPLVRQNGSPNLNTNTGFTIAIAQEGALAVEVCTQQCVDGVAGNLPGQFNSGAPWSMAFDAAGNLWVGDVNRVQQFE